MSGVTKHIYDREIMDINVMWNKQLKKIEIVLPYKYNDGDIIELLRKYYPHEWKSVEYKKQYYDQKDKYLIKKTGKARYKMPSAEELIRNNKKFKYLLSDKIKKNYSNSFDRSIWENNKDSLWRERKNKIDCIDKKISNAKAKTQMVTPVFLDQLIGLYERKSTSQKDRVYIIHELKKYYNAKVINFFFKVNDVELNRQLREIAFYHLKNFNYQPRLRRQKYMRPHTKKKKCEEYLKKVYPYETYEIQYSPDELEYRIENGKEQKMKSYDYFISHSSKDHELVQDIIAYENSIGKNIFCDWINDSDYLKRNLLCEATLKVIEWRLQQSKAIIFLKTKNSIESVWCKYELNYVVGLNKPIYYLDENKVRNGDFTLVKYGIEEFVDSNYKELVLI